MKLCDDSENQKWVLREGGFIRHHKLNVCLDARDHTEIGVSAQRCNSALETQRWLFTTTKAWKAFTGLEGEDGEEKEEEVDEDVKLPAMKNKGVGSEVGDLSLKNWK